MAERKPVCGRVSVSCQELVGYTRGHQHQRLWATRRYPHCRTRGQQRIDRLAVPAALRRRPGVCPADRRRSRRPLSGRTGQLSERPTAPLAHWHSLTTSHDRSYPDDMHHGDVETGAAPRSSWAAISITVNEAVATRPKIAHPDQPCRRPPPHPSGSAHPAGYPTSSFWSRHRDRATGAASSRRQQRDPRSRC